MENTVKNIKSFNDWKNAKNIFLISMANIFFNCFCASVFLTEVNIL